MRIRALGLCRLKCFHFLSVDKYVKNIVFFSIQWGQILNEFVSVYNFFHHLISPFIKIMFSKKATIIEKIFTVDLTFTK